MNLEGLSDAKLMHMMGNGRKEEAFSILYNRYYQDLYECLNRGPGKNPDSEDLTQDTFVKLLTKHATFKQIKNASFKTWLYQIAINTKKDHYKKEDVLKRKKKSIMDFLTELTEAPESIQERAIEKINLSDCLNKLKESDSRRYEIIKLIHLYGHPYQEVSDEMRIPVGTIKSEVHRAKSYLKELISSG